MDQALKMKRFKTNGPMPNLLANELRKVMDQSPMKMTKGRNNSDLKKLAASSRLDTSMGRLDSSLIPKKKKKRRKTISPFLRLYNNNYKRRRVSPTADFSAFSTHSRKSSNLTKRR
jgi:hypothetical protein